MIRSLAFVLVTVVLALTLTVATVGAGTIHVSPGVGTLQAAIDAATAPATIQMAPGRYTGPVNVNKPLKILAKNGMAEIDGNCAAAVALDITADHVIVKGTGRDGSVLVHGGTSTQVRVANHNFVTLKHVDPVASVASSPAPLQCGTEQNGLEISGTSSTVKVQQGASDGFPGAGILVSGIAAGTPIQLNKYGAGVNGIGLLIENSGKGAALGTSGIVVKAGQSSLANAGAFAWNSTAEIRLMNSDGVVIRKHHLDTRTSDTGVVGIDLDASSNANLIEKNLWDDASPGMNTAYVDHGTGNCGSGNNFIVPACQ